MVSCHTVFVKGTSCLLYLLNIKHLTVKHVAKRGLTDSDRMNLWCWRNSFSVSQQLARCKCEFDGNHVGVNINCKVCYEVH